MCLRHSVSVARISCGEGGVGIVAFRMMIHSFAPRRYLLTLVGTSAPQKLSAPLTKRGAPSRSISYDGHVEDKRLARNVLDSDEPDRPVVLSVNPYAKEERKCILCRYNIQLNYKNPRLLQQFVSSFSGRVYERHITGLCSAQYENLLRMIHLSRRAGYMPVLVKEPKFLRDPRLFDPLRPARPHSFA